MTEEIKSERERTVLCIVSYLVSRGEETRQILGGSIHHSFVRFTMSATLKHTNSELASETLAKFRCVYLWRRAFTNVHVYTSRVARRENSPNSRWIYPPLFHDIHGIRMWHSTCRQMLLPGVDKHWHPRQCLCACQHIHTKGCSVYDKVFMHVARAMQVETCRL